MYWSIIAINLTNQYDDKTTPRPPIFLSVIYT